VPTLLTPPRRVLVAGDWHRHIAWALAIVRLLPSLLPDEAPRLILHAGDFGITSNWEGTRYLNRLNQALEEADAYLWFADGNHENFDLLYELAGDPATTDPVEVHERIIWLPRGHRWSWHNRTWLALGGAVSVDRVALTEQVNWWSDEEITASQTQRVLAGGTADVMLCHDAPSTVRLRLPPPVSWWSDRDLARADRHRERLQEIVDQVQPSYLMHGHYHLAHEQVVKMTHGPVRVTGFDRDEARWGNYRILNVETMEFEAGVPQQPAASEYLLERPRATPGP